MAVKVIREKCLSCGSCEEECPFDAIKIDDIRYHTDKLKNGFENLPLDHIDDVPVVDEDKCVECGRCVKVCPVDALYIEKDS
ncbi:MAG: DUF362 domain-containing protein [Tepidanaerobacteraceae bacterium]